MIKKLMLLGTISTSLFSIAQKVSFVPSVGYGWRVAETPSGFSKQEKDYIKGLKSGLHFDLSAYYHINNVGIGLKFSNYSASSNGMIAVNNSQRGTIYVPISTTDNITFMGTSIMYSNYNEPTKHKLFVDGSLGIISYTTKTGNVKGTGSSLGLDAGFGYQYALSDHIFIGPKLSMTAGTLTKMKINGTTMELGDAKEGLTRVSLSGVATFHF
ncbi:outer membrane beta-barrel protein [Chryseobacterium indologenes]|uniref:outer membrane beta-barrel protein n=1 Tax=Chryseobacterium TaxID=59732 RepID=UPI00162A5475|nr:MULTISPECIES: outer membrane beta-barrel protein [Chryseobacterium]MDM1554497.1 outer membrane beta-barrel protein [Chryseobacterium indologenes]WET47356.1 outer membrane beta-barrel protein [Chryseobacterium indologenes]